MNRKVIVPLLVIVVAVLGVSRNCLALDTGAAKKLVEENHCNNCHSVKTAGISVVKGAADDKDEGEDAGKEKHTPPDLSDEGTRHDADFISKFLIKKESLQPGDRKHGKRFKGTREERETVSEFLGSLKDVESAKKGNAEIKAAQGKKK